MTAITYIGIFLIVLVIVIIRDRKRTKPINHKLDKQISLLEKSIDQKHRKWKDSKNQDKSLENKLYREYVMEYEKLDQLKRERDNKC